MPPAPLDDYDLASPFRVDWLDDRLAANHRDDLERAVAEKAACILRAARFADLLHSRAGTELEIKVWLETGFDPAFVSVFLEPRLGKHYFLVMDSYGRDRLGAVVFERVPSVTGAEATDETHGILRAFGRVVADGQDRGEIVAAVRREYEP